MHSSHSDVNIHEVRATLKQLFYPERRFIRVVLVYGLAISLLTLAVPIAVQTLINTVANIGSRQAIVSLAGVLLVTLLLSAGLSALRTMIMERYERHVYARLTAELSFTFLSASPSYFEGRRNLDTPQRYFDIMTLQKNLPTLLIDGFAFILQALVGFTLVSYYHPSLFLFNLVIIGVIWLIWKAWGKGAIRSAVLLSRAKYHTSKWLTDIGQAHDFFKSNAQIEFACNKTDQVTAEYINAHKSHFRYTFAQTLMYLLLYALASASLLGIGGWLVTQGELSIGQLVAAELILSAIFFGLSKFANYLKLYYELCGAADELGLALNVPVERLTQAEGVTPEDSGLQFYQVDVTSAIESRSLCLTLQPSDKVMAVTDHVWMQREIVSLLKRYHEPKSGWVRLGGKDLADYDIHHLRQNVSVIDRNLIVECSIVDYFKMAKPDATISEIHDVIDFVGLESGVNRLSDGINTLLSPQGSPFVPAEFLLLKLAAAILSQSQVIILTPHFDSLPHKQLELLLNRLQLLNATMIYFTNAPQTPGFDYCLPLDWAINSTAAGCNNEEDRS